MVQVFGKLLYLGKLHASGFRQVATLGQVVCFRFSASCYTWASCMLQVFSKLHASDFRQVAILGQVACFRFSASCYTWASCMLQVFGKLLHLGKLHASGFRQVATLGQVACFRVILASCYTWVGCNFRVAVVVTARSSGKGAYSKVVWLSCYTCTTYIQVRGQI